jgi:hypothetical protein
MMNIRTPQPSQQAKILRSFLASQGLSVRHTVALEAIARVTGFANTQALRANAPDDCDLAAYMDANPDVVVGTSAKGAAPSMEDVRQALSNVAGFAADNFPNIDFEQCIAAHKGTVEGGNPTYTGLTLTACFESDVESGRVAPFAYYAKRVNTPTEGWTEDAIPESHDNVADLKVKMLLKALKNAGLQLTDAYDESPKRKAA